MEWLILVTLIFFGAEELISEDEPEVVVLPEPIVSTEPVYVRGRYYKTEQGYFVSNLTTEPAKAEGCDRPVLTANLSEPRYGAHDLNITEVAMSCEGES